LQAISRALEAISATRSPDSFMLWLAEGGDIVLEGLVQETLTEGGDCTVYHDMFANSKFKLVSTRMSTEWNLPLLSHEH
jgi:hypothetical protein